MHLIDNDTVRWIIVLKLLHWFFAQYIIKILHKYVVLISVKNQWVYITKDDWCKMQEEFIKEKVNSCVLVPWTPVQADELKFNIPIGRYKFIPSSSGLRALLIAKYIYFLFMLEINMYIINKKIYTLHIIPDIILNRILMMLMLF